MTAIPGDKIGSSNKQAKRKLRFHDRVQFKTIRHVSEFSEDEIKNGWYDKDDFNRMSDNVSDIAKLIANGETSLNGEELCTRGLEHIVEEELADYRAEKMINSIDAVLDEQEEQWDEGKEEPGLIAELYAEYAKPLLREAHLIGLKDAEEGYKNWDDLFEQKEYHELTPQLSESPQLKAEKIATKKETKNVKKSNDSLQRKQHENKSTKKEKLSSSTAVRKEKLGPSETKVKKNKVKKSDDLSTGEKPSKTKKDASKSKVRKSKPKRNEEQSKPSSCTDLSLSSSSSSLQSSTSSPMSPRTSSMSLKNQNSISSINSFTLRDASSRSILEEINTTGKDPMTKRSTMLKRNLPLTTKDEGQNDKNANSLSPKKQGKRSPRRSVSDRKHGTELSPFVFRRDGTLAFRKPDVEKLKREQKEKRKSFVEDSLTKFLQFDEDEDDILAGILSGVGK